jgi:hypothetical protein
MTESVSHILKHLKNEKKKTSFESCMKTHMLVSVQGLQVLSQLMFKSLRVHDG